MVLWRFSLRGLVSRRGRAAMTLTSIVIAVAAVVSVGVSTATTRRAYREMFASVSGRASLEILAEGGASFSEGVLPQVEQTPGVKVAVPIIQRLTIMYWHGRRTGLLLVGTDPAKHKALYDYTLAEGRELDADDGVLLGAGFAETMGIRPGDQIGLLTRTRRLHQRTTVLGTVTSESAASLWLGGMVFAPLGEAQRWFAARGRIDAIQVVLQPSADGRKVMAELARQLPVGLSVRPPRSHSQLVEETLASGEQGLRLATAFSLVLAYFMILNTFLMNVGERRRQLAIMRALGATRRQIARLLYGEALVMGTVGSALGVLVGLGGAYVLNQSLNRVLLANLPAMSITAPPLVLGTLFGLGVSLVGVAVPARRASHLSPLEGISGIVREDMEHASHKFTIVGLAMSLVSGTVLGISIAGWLPVDVAIITSVFVLVGAVLLVPAVLGTFAREVTRVLFPWMRAEANVAYRQILRHRSRSALTAGVLFVATATGVGMGSTLLDNIQDIQKWCRREMAGDFFIRAMVPDMATGMSADLPEALGDEIRATPGVARMATARFVQAEAEGQSVVVIARDFPPDRPLFLNLAGGDEDQIHRELAAGAVVIGTVLAERTGLKAGDEITLKTLQGPKRLPIAALTNEYLVGGLAIWMPYAQARRLLGVEGVDTYVVRAEPGALGEVQARLQKLCQEHGVLLQSFTDITRMIDNMARGVRACLWGILTLGFIVAAFSVVNTLTMNVLEQTREFGLLRVVAMTRRQVRRTILAQAAILAGVALVPGTLSGLLVSYLINLATTPAVGHPVAFGFHPLLIGLTFVGAFAMVLAAAWLPAQRAARLNLLAALQYE
jgi:putative ABC transport system permease protein